MSRFEQILQEVKRSYIQPRMYFVVLVFYALGIYSLFNETWVAIVLLSGGTFTLGYALYNIYAYNKVLLEAYKYYQTSKTSAKQFLQQQYSILEYNAKIYEKDIDRIIASSDRRATAHSRLNKIRYVQDVYQQLIDAIDGDIEK